MTQLDDNDDDEDDVTFFCFLLKDVIHVWEGEKLKKRNISSLILYKWYKNSLFFFLLFNKNKNA